MFWSESMADSQHKIPQRPQTELSYGEIGNAMTPRERFIAAIKRQQPDMVPLFVRYKKPVRRKLAEIYGCDGYELEIRLGNDCLIVQLGLNAEYSHKEGADGVLWTSEWGVTYEIQSEVSQPRDHPLKEYHDIDTYPWPDPHRSQRMLELKEVMGKYHPIYAVMADLSCTLFEACYAHLRGMQQAMMDLYLNREFVAKVLDGLTEYYTALGCHAIEQGIDIIRIGDDIGSQNGIMIPPGLWRELVKPRLEAMIRAFKASNHNIIVKYHSCGDFSPIIPDLIELGVELVGTMQPCGRQADMAWVKREYGDKLAFLGGLDVQQLLPHGTPAEVRRGVKEVLAAYAVGGGYIFMPSHYVDSDVPLENIWALLSAVHDYRRYPLRFETNPVVQPGLTHTSASHFEQ